MNKWITIDVKDFEQAFKKVSFAVAKEGDPKFTFTAINVVIDDKTIYLMGSNGHRISIGQLPTDAGIAKREVLVSTNSLSQISKMFDGTCKLYFGTNSIVAKKGLDVIFIRLISGNFPDVSKIIPKHPNTLVVDAGEFLGQVKKASLALDKNNTLRIILSENLMKLSSKTRIQRRSATVEWPIKFTGKSLTFAVNCDYLMDALKAADNGDITMHYDEDNDPILFTQPGFRYLMVPQEI